MAISRGPSPLGSLPLTVWQVGTPAVLALLGFLIAPLLVSRPLARLSYGMTPTQFVLTVVGLILGLVVAALLATALAALPGLLGAFAPLLTSVIFAVLGVRIVRGREAEFGPKLDRWFGVIPLQDGRRSERILVDTSAIIDGRILDISQTGFLHGTLVIPRFVLDELRHIADSSDPLRRNRGRRGLDILNRLQKDSPVPVEILDRDVPELLEVDTKLVKLASMYGCPVITNDFNLNRVAEFEGVTVLNVNQLANAVKSVVLPGEELVVKIIQEGKEFGQGVGFMDDGTMVVVEGGRRYLSQEIEVIVTRVLQTAAGRMIFGQPKPAQTYGTGFANEARAS
jgi:uncharacterized protein YacL